MRVTSRIVDSNDAHTQVNVWIEGKLIGSLIFTTANFTEEWNAFSKQIDRHLPQDSHLIYGEYK